MSGRETTKWEHVHKPPLGVVPKWARMEERLTELRGGVSRYRFARHSIPQEWLEEIREIELYLMNRSQIHK